jgi:hypothetical protein
MPMLFPTSPTVGQVFTSGGRSWVWSGATWDSPTATNTLLAPYGTTLLLTQDIASTSAFIIDNIFTAEFINYRILVRLDTSTGTNVSMAGRLRKSGSYSASGWNTAGWYAGAEIGNSGIFFASVGQPGFSFVQFGRTGRSSYASIDLFSPQASGRAAGATFQSYASYAADGSVMITGGAEFSTVDSYDGFALVPSSGSFTGNVQIFGYRK